MPYDTDSPLSQLASGWRDFPRHGPRTTTPPDSPIRDPLQEQFNDRGMTYDGDSLHSKKERRHFPQPRPLPRPPSPLRHSPERGTYYIVPGGTNVIFQDEDGNEITRVGDFSGRRRRISPIIVQDEHGREIYRTSDIQNSSRAEPNRHRSRGSRRDEFTDEANHPRSRSAEIHSDRHRRWWDFQSGV
ncbi:hypothetical protein DFH07DRAFT_26267 [Mycena maculata]|uniref:Uncharacterized protein n=1 Tax=Mycena maculata TaxID=230809 RepID=A0AAD7IJG9_9AGAR|nr:hypothetical protein DFH07DRAFT_26267 [Mycena maculata]